MDDRYFVSRFKQAFSGRDTNGFEPLDFIAAFGTPLDALFYSRLFLPDFVEIDGLILLEGTVTTSDDRDRLTAAIQDKQSSAEVEKEWNLIEIPLMLFTNGLDNASDDDLVQLAFQLREAWTARLQALFPTKRFTVEICDSEQTGGGIGLVFYQA